MEKEREVLFIRRLNAKQKEAFPELFQEFYRALVLYAFRYVQRSEIAEDIVQDLFVSIWEDDRHFTSYSGFRSFLYASVRNSSINSLIHQEVEDRYVSYASREARMPAEFDGMEEEVLRRVFQAVERLPGRCREIFLMHMDGKTNAEIAAELRLSIETVKAQKKNALHQLRKDMGVLGIYLCFLVRMKYF